MTKNTPDVAAPTSAAAPTTAATKSLFDFPEGDFFYTKKTKIPVDRYYV